MLITESGKLAEALFPILKNKVVVRYAMRGHPKAFGMSAELLTLDAEDSGFLAHLAAVIEVTTHASVSSVFNITHLERFPDTLEKITARWSKRSFNDWCHDQPFMGALEVFRDGMPYTSLKTDAHSDRWRFLTGLLVGVLDQFDEHSVPLWSAGGADMKRRFSAFAAQSQRAWAEEMFIWA